MSRTRKFYERAFRKERNHKIDKKDAKSQVDEFLEEYEKKNQNPYISLR